MCPRDQVLVGQGGVDLEAVAHAKAYAGSIGLGCDFTFGSLWPFGGLPLGGIDLGLRQWARTVCYVEREPFAVSVLTSRMRSGELDDAPVWDDLTTFDGRPWRGCVDLIAGGIPCQGNSVAGKRRGGGRRTGRHG